MSQYVKTKKDGQDVIVETRTVEQAVWTRPMLQDAIDALQTQLWQLAIRKAELEAQRDQLPEEAK